MDRVLTLTVFRRVAELRSFSAAARELGLSNAAVSKHVQILEERLRTRLLQRTTRSVAPTAAGEAYLARCARILDDLSELDGSIARSSMLVKGTLRVNAPSAFGLRFVSPLVPQLLATHPELAIDLSLTDRFVDLVEEGVDVVLRIATELADSSTLVAQRLVGCAQIVCATPRYLREHGTPRTPADLREHACLVYGLRPPRWSFHDGDRTIEIPVTGRLRVDNSLAIRDAMLAHAGIGMLPRFYVDDLLRARRLAVVLGDLAAPTVWIHAVYPRQRYLSTKVRAFIEHVRKRLERERWAFTRA